MVDASRTSQGSRTVLVTGGAGFIGSHLAAAFAQRGDHVTVLDDLSTGAVTNVPAGARFVQAELFDPAVDALFVRHAFAVVVHCAAQTSVERSLREPDLDYRLNVEGTARMGRLAQEAGSRFVFFSSGGAIYGETDEPATEQREPAPLSPYGRHKYLAERVLIEMGIDPIIVRPSNVYGPRQRWDLEGGVVSVFLNRLLRREPLELHAEGRAIRDFVYVDDLVEAVLRLVDGDHRGTWNVATGKETPVREVLTAVLTAVPVGVPVTEGPRRAGDVARSCLNIDAIAKATGWRPKIGVADGVRLMARDLLAHA
jgi:UDP-glucose 4-epimerase